MSLSALRPDHRKYSRWKTSEKDSRRKKCTFDWTKLSCHTTGNVCFSHFAQKVNWAFKLGWNESRGWFRWKVKTNGNTRDCMIVHHRPNAPISILTLINWRATHPDDDFHPSGAYSRHAAVSATSAQRRQGVRRVCYPSDKCSTAVQSVSVILHLWRRKSAALSSISEQDGGECSFSFTFSSLVVRCLSWTQSTEQ